jgi:hypothetical protein
MSVASSQELAFMTIAKVLSPSQDARRAETINTYRVFGFSTERITGVKLSGFKLFTNSSRLIYSSIPASVFLMIFRFLATPPQYFNFLFSSSFRNGVLLTYPASIKTIFGRYLRFKLRSINSSLSSGFFLNSSSSFPDGREEAG